MKNYLFTLIAFVFCAFSSAGQDSPSLTATGVTVEVLNESQILIHLEGTVTFPNGEDPHLVRKRHSINSCSLVPDLFLWEDALPGDVEKPITIPEFMTLTVSPVIINFNFFMTTYFPSPESIGVESETYSVLILEDGTPIDIGVGCHKLGCMDNQACNYDFTATYDGGYGDCDYSCVGCTDPGACNYDLGTTNDDGSCEYQECVSINFTVETTTGCSPLTVFVDNDSEVPNAATCTLHWGENEIENCENLSQFEIENPGVYDIWLEITTPDGGNFQSNIFEAEVLESPEVPLIEQNENTLICSNLEESWLSQWELNGNFIGNGLSIEATQSGLYRLIVTNENTCNSQSDEFDFTYTSIFEEQSSNFQVLSNPSSSPTLLSSDGVVKQIDIFSLDGRLVKSETFTNQYSFDFLGSGSYLVIVHNNERIKILILK